DQRHRAVLRRAHPEQAGGAALVLAVDVESGAVAGENEVVQVGERLSGGDELERGTRCGAAVEMTAAGVARLEIDGTCFAGRPVLQRQGRWTGRQANGVNG